MLTGATSVAMIDILFGDGNDTKQIEQERVEIYLLPRN